MEDTERPICHCGRAVPIRSGFFRAERDEGRVVLHAAYCSQWCAEDAGDDALAFAQPKGEGRWICLDMDDHDADHPFAEARSAIDELAEAMGCHTDRRAATLGALLQERPQLWRDPICWFACHDAPIGPPLADGATTLGEWLDARLSQIPADATLEQRVNAIPALINDLILVDVRRPLFWMSAPDLWALIDALAESDDRWMIDRLVEDGALSYSGDAVAVLDSRAVRAALEPAVIARFSATVGRGVELWSSLVRGSVLDRPAFLSAMPFMSPTGAAEYAPRDEAEAVRMLLADHDPVRRVTLWDVRRVVSEAGSGCSVGHGAAAIARWLERHAHRVLPEPDPAIDRAAVLTRMRELLNGPCSHWRHTPDLLKTACALDGSGAWTPRIARERCAQLREGAEPMNEDEATFALIWFVGGKYAPDGWRRMIPTHRYLSGVVVGCVGYDASGALTVERADILRPVGWAIDSGSRTVVALASDIRAMAIVGLDDRRVEGDSVRESARAIRMHAGAGGATFWVPPTRPAITPPAVVDVCSLEGEVVVPISASNRGLWVDAQTGSRVLSAKAATIDPSVIGAGQLRPLSRTHMHGLLIAAAAEAAAFACDDLDLDLVLAEHEAPGATSFGPLSVWHDDVHLFVAPGDSARTGYVPIAIGTMDARRRVSNVAGRWSVAACLIEGEFVLRRANGSGIELATIPREAASAMIARSMLDAGEGEIPDDVLPFAGEAIDVECFAYSDTDPIRLSLPPSPSPGGGESARTPEPARV